jgi:hypothetical protein
LLDVWFDDDRRGFAIGAFGLILRTEDGGASWQPWKDRTDNPDSLHLNAIRAVGGELYIVGEQGLLLKLSRDGGRFEKLPTPYRAAISAWHRQCPGGARVRPARQCLAQYRCAAAAGSRSRPAAGGPERPPPCCRMARWCWSARRAMLAQQRRRRQLPCRWTLARAGIGGAARRHGDSWSVAGVRGMRVQDAGAK